MVQANSLSILQHEHRISDVQRFAETLNLLVLRGQIFYFLFFFKIIYLQSCRVERCRIDVSLDLKNIIILVNQLFEKVCHVQKDCLCLCKTLYYCWYQLMSVFRQHQQSWYSLLALYFDLFALKMATVEENSVIKCDLNAKLNSCELKDNWINIDCTI